MIFNSSYLKQIISFMQSLGAGKLMRFAVLTGITLAKDLDRKEQEIMGNVLIVTGKTLTMASHSLDDAENKSKWQQYGEIEIEIQELQKRVQDLQIRLASLSNE